MAKIKHSHTDRSSKQRNLDKVILNETQVTETNAINSPVSNINWDVTQGEVHSDTKLEDDDKSGREIILRSFQFRYPPGPHKIPTKEEVLTPAYVKFLEAQLYFVDNLEIELAPRVTYQKDGFTVFVPCRARKGHLVRERPNSLAELAHESPRNTK